MREKEIFNRLCRTSFKVFLRKVFQELYPGKEFIDVPYIDYLCYQAVRIVKGELKNSIINLPPRHIKSLIFSVALPTYILGLDPSKEIMCVSYGEDIANKLARQRKKVLDAFWYQGVFVHTKISSDKHSIMDFETTAGGGCFTATINGGLTGRGADILIIDDPHKAKEEDYESALGEVIDIYNNTLESRLNNPLNAQIVLIMQRIHPNDLTGYLLKNRTGFEQIKLPLFATEDEEFEVSSDFEKKFIFKRQKGEVLNHFMDKTNIDDYISDPYVFQAQYQQNPLAKGTGCVKKDILGYYNQEPRFSKIILSWDTASTTKETSAYSVCAVLGVGHELGINNIEKYYLLEIWKKRVDFPALIQNIKDKIFQYDNKLHGGIITLIEDADSGRQAIQQLRKEGFSIISCKPEGAKETRFNLVHLKLKEQKLLLPSWNPSWYGNFEDELLSFPNSPYKDQCDALSQAIAFLENDTNRPIYQNTQVPLASNARRVIGGKGSCPSFLLNPGCLSGIASRGGPVYSDTGIGTLACRGTYRPKPY